MRSWPRRAPTSSGASKRAPSPRPLLPLERRACACRRCASGARTYPRSPSTCWPSSARGRGCLRRLCPERHGDALARTLAATCANSRTRSSGRGTHGHGGEIHLQACRRKCVRRPRRRVGPGRAATTQRRGHPRRRDQLRRGRHEGGAGLAVAVARKAGATRARRPTARMKRTTSSRTEALGIEWEKDSNDPAGVAGHRARRQSLTPCIKDRRVTIPPAPRATRLSTGGLAAEP